MPPFGAGVHAILVVGPVYLIPGYTTPSQPGRHSGGAKPRERPAFFVPEQEHFFDLNFGTLI